MRSPASESSLDRWVDLASVIVISAAAVLTAWCGYEAARWASVQTERFNEASAQRAAAGVASARSNALETIDVATFLQYVNAVATKQIQEQHFIYRRFRPEMRRAMDAWIATNPLANHSAPSSPFAMPQYRLKTDDEARRLGFLATSTFDSATRTTTLSDQFVRLTVTFAAVSFLGGISTKFNFPHHIIVVVAGLCVLIYGLIKLFGLPL